MHSSQHISDNWILHIEFISSQYSLQSGIRLINGPFILLMAVLGHDILPDRHMRGGGSDYSLPHWTSGDG